jgi:hypothetical protein
VKKIAPYAVAAALVVGLVFLVRNPRYAALGAIGIGVVVLVTMGYVAFSYRESLPPGDRLRVAAPLVAAATLLAAGVPYAYTVFPPAPRGVVTLGAPGESGTVDVRGTSASVWLTVHGRFVPTATGTADYFLTVTREGGRAERIEGRFNTVAGREPVERHVLEQRGPGRFTVRLENASQAVAMPLRVDVSARPFSTLLLSLAFAAFAAAAVAIDVMLWRRGIEPSYAAALMFPLVAVLYFQRKPASDTLAADLLAAGVIGVLAGGFGGEILARVGRMVARK